MESSTTRGFVERLAQVYDYELRCFLRCRLRGNWEITEDIRQEIYLRMLRFTTAELIVEPRAYLYRVARNVLHDYALLTSREKTTFENDIEGIGAITEDGALNVDVTRDLQSVLAKLPVAYRSILILRAIQGMSYQEIAAELDISVHTVKKYLRLAMLQCRQLSGSR